MKVGLWVEGATDGAFYPALLERVLSLREKSLACQNRRGRCIQGLKVGLGPVLKDFSLSGCTHLLLCADNHRASPGEASRHRQEAAALTSGSTCFVSVAVQELESWLLADYVTLCRVVGRPMIAKPPQVESLDQPKRYLKEALALYPTSAQIGQFVREMDLERARHESDSFNRLLEELGRWKRT